MVCFAHAVIVFGAFEVEIDIAGPIPPGIKEFAFWLVSGSYVCQISANNESDPQ